MIALSIRQPWAWAIVHAKKRIENRGWSTAYRGPILLHAAKGCTANEYAEAMQWMLFAGVLTHQQLADAPELGEMQRGGIVGRARIVDVIPPSTELFGDCGCEKYEGVDERWHICEQYGFVLADVEPLPFVACKGALGLFRLNPDGTIPAREASQ